jgi:transposase
MTKKLRDYIAEQSKRRSFIELERELDISNVTIRDIFMEEMEKLQSGLDIETPEFIGIDEIHIERRSGRKAAWAVICNGNDHTVMDILPNRKQETIENYLQRLKNPFNVKLVTMDMWNPYRTAVYKTLPNADIVVDKYHVDSMANVALDAYRKSLKKQLGERNIVLKKDKHVLLRREDKLDWTDKVIRETWFSEIPELRTMYNLKEEFFKIYDKAQNKRQGIAMYEQWKKSIPEGIAFFDDVLTSLENWKHEITNYFTYKVNNAFVEGANSAIRAIESQGRGYDFDVLRAKVMFCVKHKVVVPKYGTNTFSKFMLNDFSNKDYGVRFNDIIRAINEGLL